MLVYVEVPTWGVNTGFAGNTAFWNNIYSCDSEMVLDGYNHPSIYVWGLFNEQNENLNTYFTNEMTIIHGLDPVAGSGRVCAVANYAGAATKFTGDIFADNYNYNFAGLNTEAYGNMMADNNIFGNWFRNYIRGGTMDVDPAGEAAFEVNCMQQYYWLSSDKMAGGHFWCFMDYSSGRNTVGREGIVDRLWLPKQVYFRFRNTLTNAATDYWTAGTPTKIDLVADLTTLKADGADISLITATLRDDAGACKHKDCSITFTASPAGCVAALYSGHSVSPSSGNPVTCAVEGGRAGVLLRTSRTAGAISVSASSSCGLSAASVTLSSQQVTESFYTDAVPIASPLQQANASAQRFRMTSGARGHFFLCPSGHDGILRIVNMQGKTVLNRAVKKGEALFVNRLIMGRGVFYAAWEDGATRASSRLTMVN
jgi:hypothetical protein